MEITNHYITLGLENFSSIEDIKSRYQFLLNAKNPTKFLDPVERKKAEIEIEKIKSAYEIIGNPLKKDSFDQKLREKLVNKNFEPDEYQPKNRPDNQLQGSKSKKSNDDALSINQNIDSKRLRNIYLFAGLFFVCLIIFGFLNSRNSLSNLSPTVIREKTQTPIPTPTISINKKKQEALNTAISFSKYFENGNINSKEFLYYGSEYYDDLIEIIDETIHDTMKWGKYLRIYDLEVSNFSYPEAQISGFIENRGPVWLKYYFDIYLEEINSSWKVISISMRKT